MGFLAFLAISLGLYLTWAVVLSDNFFHRIWSLALSFLLLLTIILCGLPISTYTIPLSVLALLDLALCIALSPAQIFIYRIKTVKTDYKALEIFPQESSSSDSNEEAILVDIVAVHGLASNPKTTWESRKYPQDDGLLASVSKPMWLRDFLPKENLNARVLAFNHNTAWEAYALSKSLKEYGDDLLRALNRARDTSEKKKRAIIFIGHSFGGLIIKQAVVNAREDENNDFCIDICQQTLGFIFLGTPHKGAQLTIVGRMISLFSYWKGSSTSLLGVVLPKSVIIQALHDSFMRFLAKGCGIKNTVCVFETMKESILGFPITHVVEKDSAVIDGSQKIGFEKNHRSIHRFESREDEDYQDMCSWIRKWVKKIEEITQEERKEKTKEKTQEEQDCLKSLAFPEMNLRGNDINGQASKTCAWLLENESYTTWLRQHQGLLWIKGKPGAGKSTLLKYALRQCKRQEPPTKLVVASFFFHGRGAPIQKSRLGLFRALLHQILDQVPDLLSEFTLRFKKKRDTQGEPGKKWEWHEAELGEFLKASIPLTSKAFLVRIYVDALDECGEKEAIYLVDYFKSFTSKQSLFKAGLSICFSCRQYPIGVLENGLTVCVEDENHRDIEIYVQDKLERGFSDKIKAQGLKEEIVKKASGVFQWVVLVVPTILELHRDGKSIKAIRETLQKTPQELGSLYQDVLGIIKDRPQSLQLMQWICFAQRPLSLEELRFAMAVDADTPHSSLRKCQESVEYVETNEKMEKRVKSLSGGLVEVKEHQDQRVAQFIHQSVSDYLIQSGLQQLDSPSTSSVTGHAHFQLSRACIRYMSMEEVLSYSGQDKEDLRHQFPLLQYAVTNWISHAEAVEAEQIPQKDLPYLFHWPSNEILECWTYLYQEMDPYAKRSPAKETNLLHITSRYGLLSALRAVFDSENMINVDSRCKYSRTSLSWAAENGHEAVVKLLLEKGAELESKDSEYGQTPLSLAARSGHETVVKLLIEKGAELESKDSEYGQTSLSLAAENGHETVVKLLLEKGAELESKDSEYGQTPLSLAARSGHETVVKLLIEKGAELESKDNEYGQTPLSWAAWNGHEAVVKLLLKKGAELESKDSEFGQTSLSWAAWNGHEAVVKLLIEKGAELESKDSEYGRTPLSWAAWNGHETVVKLLIEKGAELESKDSEYGQTSLSLAAENGHETVVKLLIEKGAELESKDSEYGQTSLSLAAENGHETVVKLLIEKGAELESKDNEYGQTPLSWAAWNGRKTVVKLLLEKGAELESKGSKYGRTPLSWAAENGHEAVVKLLLDNKAATNTEDNYGYTAIQLAAFKEHKEVEELLIEKGASEVEDIYCLQRLFVEN